MKASSAISEKHIGPAKQRHRGRSQLSNAAFSLDPEHVGRLIAGGATQRDQLLVRLLAETGLRRSEATALRTSDVDVASRVLVVWNGKGGKQRIVPITKGLAQALLALPGGADQSVIFRSRQSAALSSRQVNRIVASAGQRAGITNPNPRRRHVTCHLLRHTFARLWKASGGSIESLSKILGHSSVKTTWDLYGTESLGDIKRNYERTLAVMFHHE